ncbi:MAG: helix-turn-helix transcriptional regulator, partial [Gammaproteobacteria bacterium]|nr:helix-turn-helix transcriptional regulator [Gammaproteobacteria bacterium]
MSEIKQISRTLKELLRQNKLTYRDVARQLEMSEANIKRIFSTDNFSLERLESICNIMKISLSDLFQIIEKQKVLPTKLTEKQEEVLSSDTKLLLVAVCTRDSWTIEEI